jgi:endonuclease/exonuclease/phosphatase family metal-dependent hydrolase
MHLKVMTYNIHRAIGVDRRFRPERITQIVSHYDPDLLLLQEVDNGVPRSRGMEMARELAGALSYPHWTAGYNVTLRRGQYGNATFSRYPIITERNIDLTVGDRKRRGCQYTRLQVEKVSGHSHHLDVFNLHLGLSAWERARQIGTLVRSPEFRALGDDHAVMVAGDFNDWRSLLAPVFTEILGFGAATDRINEHHYEMRTYPSFSPTGSLDKVFYRGPLRAIHGQTSRMQVARVASDHLPVIVDFELR